jgi:predicted amidophosphoribosyltransferase
MVESFRYFPALMHTQEEKLKMATCPDCGATVPEGTVYCGNCKAAISSAATSSSALQPQAASKIASPNAPSSGDMSARLEKAMRRTELLSYAAAGLGLAILAVIILIAFL